MTMGYANDGRYTMCQPITVTILRSIYTDVHIVYIHIHLFFRFVWKGSLIKRLSIKTRYKTFTLQSHIHQ